MRAQALLEQWLLKRADQWVARRRQRLPSKQRLAAARIVAHRGVYDNRLIFENTMAAFERFLEAGGWGIELDVRWTRDGCPWSPMTRTDGALFGVPRPIADMDLATVQRSLPQVPTLAAVIARFGGHAAPDGGDQVRTPLQHDPSAGHLRTPFRASHPRPGLPSAEPGPGSAVPTPFCPSQACVPIAQMNLPRVVRATQANSWGGMAGHYALIRGRHIEAMHRRGCQIGTGYINSPNCLYREVARGVDWLFSDQALTLQKILMRSTRVGRKDSQDE